jgi:predicted phosphodiesterase
MAFTRAPSSSPNSQDYFSFDYGDMHILVLDTEVSYAPGSPQYMFVQNDLAATTRAWKIVACHKPAYCSGGHGEDAGMIAMTTNIFEPAHVDLVIAGHSHFYQHNLVHNLHHLVVGTAGAPQYVPTTASYTIKSVQVYNYAIFDVTPATLRITVYSNTDALLDTLQFSKPPTSVGEQMDGVTEFRLDQNYPNPFNPSTMIKYELPTSGHVKLKIYDVLGREVATLVNAVKQPGTYTVQWNANGVASGLYFYRLQTGRFSTVQKMLLVR